MSKEEALFLLPAGNVVFGSLSELPARSVDLSALNLTELVNGMLGRALKGSLFLKAQPGPFLSCSSSLPDSDLGEAGHTHVQASPRSEWRRH